MADTIGTFCGMITAIVVNLYRIKRNNPIDNVTLTHIHAEITNHL